MKDSYKILYVLALICINIYFFVPIKENMDTTVKQEYALKQWQDSVREAYHRDMFLVYYKLSEKQIAEIKRQLETYGIYDVTYAEVHSITNVEIAEEYCNSPEYYDTFK